MLSSQPGLGHNILVSARAFRSPDLYAGVMVLGALGYVTNAALERAEAYWLRWRPGPTGA
jgi:ABC-type nitrate/sulfonate/bicarbonate transport system permease component